MTSQSVPALPPPGTIMRHKSTGQEYEILDTGHLVSVKDAKIVQPFHALQFPECYEAVTDK